MDDIQDIPRPDPSKGLSGGGCLSSDRTLSVNVRDAGTDDALPHLDQGFANWIAKSLPTAAEVAVTAPSAAYVTATMSGLAVAGLAAVAGGDAVRPNWNTATALSLTIAHQQDEIDTLRGMLGVRERQVDDLRQEIDLLTKQTDIIRAALDDALDREERNPPDRAEPEWTAPLGMLPRGMR